MKEFTIYNFFPDYNPKYPRRHYEPADPVALKKFEEFFGKDFDGFYEEGEEEERPWILVKAKPKIKEQLLLWK